MSFKLRAKMHLHIMSTTLGIEDASPLSNMIVECFVKSQTITHDFYSIVGHVIPINIIPTHAPLNSVVLTTITPTGLCLRMTFAMNGNEIEVISYESEPCKYIDSEGNFKQGEKEE